MATRLGAYKPSGVQYDDPATGRMYTVVHDPSGFFKPDKATFDQSHVAITAWMNLWSPGMIFREEATGIEWQVASYRTRRTEHQRLVQVGGGGVLTPIGNCTGLRRG